MSHLRSVLMDPNQDPVAPCEVLDYFLRRLHSMQSASRLQAIKVPMLSIFYHLINWLCESK